MNTQPGIVSTLACVLAAALVSAPVQATPCFVAPRAGAAYEVGNVAHSTPQSLNDCTVLKVVRGEVEALYLDKAGHAHRAVLLPGHKFAPGNAASSQAPFAPLKRTYASLTEGPVSLQRGGKSFDQAENSGLPSGDVHVPADGLPLVVAGEAGKRFSYQLEDAETSRILQKGSGTTGASLVMPKSVFKPGTASRLRVAFADGTSAASEFTTPPADEERELVDALARVERDQDMDAFSRAIARALIFEDRSFGYNRELALRGAKP